MKETRQYGVPLIVSDLGKAGAAVRLKRIRFERSIGDGVAHDERWLQHMLQRHPGILPIDEIEPAYYPAIPVCMELPTSRGFIDNFFITPNGNLIFAECKLWRNAEARREVIAQVMDYAESLTAWSYEAFETAVSRAEGLDGKAPPSRLFDLFANDPELDEATFIDAVSRNLRLGRGLFFIVGDGIREEVETLAGHLQSHAGMHFALALLELASFELPDGGGYLFQPRTIMRTLNIERGIVRVEDGRVAIEAPTQHLEASGGRAPQSLSAEAFFEQLSESDPRLPRRVRAFLDEVGRLGVEVEFKRSLILRWRAMDGTGINLGYTQTNGDIWTDAVNWQGRKLDALDITHDYIRELAEAIGGEVRSMPSNEDNKYVCRGGKVVQIGDLLDHKEAWLQAIAQLGVRVNERLEGGDE